MIMSPRTSWRDSSYRSLLQHTGARSIVAWSLTGRLAFAMTNLSLLLYVHTAAGNLAVAGAAAAVNLGGTAAAAVIQGRWFDRYGVSRTLRRLTAAYLPCTVLLVMLIETRQSAWVLLPAVLAQSLTAPLMGVATRAMLPHLAPEGPARDALLRYWTISFETCYVAAPALIGVLGAWHSTRIPFIVSALLLGVAGIAYAGLPAIRRYRGAESVTATPAAGGERAGLLTLMVAALGFGAVVGFVVLTTTAVATALGHPHAAGPLFAVMTLCSVAGGAVFRTRRRELALPALMLISAGALLIPVVGPSMTLLVIGVAVAGTTLAPQLTLHSAILDDVVARDRVGVSFGWLTTAVAIGNAAGQTAAGALSHLCNPGVAAVAGALTVAAAAAGVALRRSSLAGLGSGGQSGAVRPHHLDVGDVDETGELRKVAA